MSLLKDKDRKAVQDRFQKLRDPVRLILFTQQNECEYCQQTHDLAEEIATLSDLVTVEAYDLVADEARAQEYGVDKIPAIVVMGEKDYRIRFFGIPAGYEFPTLLEAILDVGRRDPQLSPDWSQLIERVDRPVHLQVLVTPG